MSRTPYRCPVCYYGAKSRRACTNPRCRHERQVQRAAIHDAMEQHYASFHESDASCVSVQPCCQQASLRKIADLERQLKALEATADG